MTLQAHLTSLPRTPPILGPAHALLSGDLAPSARRHHHLERQSHLGGILTMNADHTSPSRFGADSPCTPLAPWRPLLTGDIASTWNTLASKHHHLGRQPHLDGPLSPPLNGCTLFNSG
uniref:Uncharacterized protein n=1 Tax=Nelumbo nucifera TaxID=4432 RepID=A0A822ZQ89_NELNU|nr:TPA_asm: hypothetical protein HUJ06_003911 [Nelumbo nucifera]